MGNGGGAEAAAAAAITPTIGGRGGAWSFFDWSRVGIGWESILFSLTFVGGGRGGDGGRDALLGDGTGLSGGESTNVSGLGVE